MESKVVVVSNSDLPVVTGKSKEDVLEESGSQVSSGGDSFEESAAELILANLVPDIDLTKKLFANQEVPEPGPTAGSPESSSDPKNSPLKLISASGPAPSSGTLVADIDDHSAGPRSPEAKNGAAHPPAERLPSKSSSSHGDLLETKSSSKETKAHPDLPSYDSQGGWSPRDGLESKPSSQETKAYPDLPSYNSQGRWSPRVLLESKPSSQETKAYPDLPSYNSQGSWSPGNSLETKNSGTLVEDSVDLNLLAGRNWRKSVEAVPGIAPAVNHAEDSNSTELEAYSSRSQSSSNSD